MSKTKGSWVNVGEAKKKKCDQKTVEDPEDVTILLIGKTGTGKSSVGNIIVNANHFEVGKNTLVCKKIRHPLPDGRRLAVIDTPGLFHTKLTAEEMKTQLTRCVSLCAPGPHVFLIVIEPKRFSKEDKEMVKIIKRMFGDEAAKYTMALFSHGDEMERDGVSVERAVYFNPSFNGFLSKCKGGFHVFNNNDRTMTGIKLMSWWGRLTTWFREMEAGATQMICSEKPKEPLVGRFLRLK